MVSTRSPMYLLHVSTTLILLSAVVATNDGGSSSEMIRRRKKDNRDLQQKFVLPFALLQAFGGTPPEGRYPLQLCQGDCDIDADCDEGLKCFQKAAGDPVPGCTGNFGSATDFCILISQPPSSEPSISMTPSDSPSSIPSITSAPSMRLTESPTSSPSNSPSLVPTVSMLPTTSMSPTVSVVPSNTPTSSPTPMPTTSIMPTKTILPSTSPTLTSMPSDLPSNLPSDVPSIVPSTSTQPSSIPTRSLTPSAAPFVIPTDGFRLKLFWQKGYMWQDEDFDRRWCAMYNYDGNPRTGKCWYHLKARQCQPEEVYTARCGDDYRQLFKFETIINGPYVDEALIMTHGGDPAYSGRCLHRFNGTATKLTTCNQTDPTQRWYAIRGGFYHHTRFEISQRKTGYYFDLCLTQEHHPKHGEVLELQDCERARSKRHRTSWWQKY